MKKNYEEMFSNIAVEELEGNKEIGSISDVGMKLPIKS